MKEVHQIQDAKYTNSLRKDLLGINSNDVSGLRKRGANTGSEDMSQAMKHHADLQEKIAEDMLALTRNLKEQTETANRIIKRDTDVSGSLNFSCSQSAQRLLSITDCLQIFKVIRNELFLAEQRG